MAHPLALAHPEKCRERFGAVSSLRFIALRHASREYRGTEDVAWIASHALGHWLASREGANVQFDGKRQIVQFDGNTRNEL